MRLRTDTPHAHVETFTFTRNAEIDDYFFSHSMTYSDAKKAAEAKRRNATLIMLCS
jgi:hypothetical protein